MVFPWNNDTITFERFMEFCLYDRDFGYYTAGREVFGRRGDYYTSPYTNQVFAHILADVLAHFHRTYLGSESFQLVELGAGEGVLGEDILRLLQEHHPQVHDRMDYLPVELNTELPERIRGVVFSNEFFDALPVHRVRVETGDLREIYVRGEGKISELEGEVSDPRIPDYMKKGFRKRHQGYEYEVNLRMGEVLEDLDDRLEAGIVLTVDYGYEWEEYDAVERPAGTLMCYHRHQLVTDPYVNPGEQDMTAHVNFELVRNIADGLGWETEPLKTQRQFLMEWGLESYLLEEQARGLLNPERIQERLGLRDLLLPGGISDTMKVLVHKVRL